MKSMLFALIILLIISPLVKAQDGAVPEARGFVISSLNTAFGVQGDFAGEYRVYPDRLELKITKADIHISEHCPYKGRRLLSEVKFALATNTDDKRWQLVNAGQAISLEQVLSPGDMYQLGEFYFYIPLDDSSIDLSKHWLVVQMEDTVLDVPEERRRKGYAYAHSCRDIFSRLQ